ncbi:MAG: hypothetical protein QM754_20450 [Tepidisphaeraceae bacterium]
MQCYHYASERSELPEKDGTYDHPIDALRYYYINRPSYATVPRMY